MDPRLPSPGPSPAPYSPAGGFPAKLTEQNGPSITQTDNDGEHGGGWAHDMLNHATYADLYKRAAAWPPAPPNGKGERRAGRFPARGPSRAGSARKLRDASWAD